MPLSDIEKRMMYFVENDATSCVDSLELNEEFEAQCNTAEYEAKMSRLLHNAYTRIKAEDPGKVRNWKESRVPRLSRFSTPSMQNASLLFRPPRFNGFLGNLRALCG